MDSSPSSSSVHGILQARILGWVAISSSRRSSQPRDSTCVSHVSCIAGGFFTTEPTGKPPLKAGDTVIQATKEETEAEKTLILASSQSLGGGGVVSLCSLALDPRGARLRPGWSVLTTLGSHPPSLPCPALPGSLSFLHPCRLHVHSSH